MGALRCPLCTTLIIHAAPARTLAAYRALLSFTGGVLCALAASSPWAYTAVRNWPFLTYTRTTYTLFDACRVGAAACEPADAGLRAGGALLALAAALGLLDALQGLARELLLWRLRGLPSWSPRFAASTRRAAMARAALAAAAAAAAAAGLALACAAPSASLPQLAPTFGELISSLSFEGLGRGYGAAVAGAVALAASLAAAALAECGAPVLRLEGGGGGGVHAEFKAAVAGDAAAQAAAAMEACGQWGGQWKGAGAHHTSAHDAHYGGPPL
jgi:hypothetical protein